MFLSTSKLNKFKVNAIVDQTGITPFAMNQINAIYAQFNSDTTARLFAILDNFAQLRESVPSQIQACISATTSRLNDEAFVLRNTLDFC